MISDLRCIITLPHQMIEFIELNKVLGVEHFTLYNHTIGPQVSCLLRKYQEQVGVEL